MFELDPAKFEADLTKHRIDFEQAKQLWSDSRRILFEARSDLEPNGAIIAQYDAKLWCAVYTLRKDNIRITSVRRARKKEEVIYNED